MSLLLFWGAMRSVLRSVKRAFPFSYAVKSRNGSPDKKAHNVLNNLPYNFNLRRNNASNATITIINYALCTMHYALIFALCTLHFALCTQSIGFP